MNGATRVVLVRHGETAWNVDKRVQGHTDIPLNATGRWQAQRLGAALAHEGLDAIYSSDLQRALATAQALASAVGLPVVTEPELRERRFGCFEGVTFAEIDRRWPVDALRWRQRDPAFGPEGGETLNGFHARCVAIARTLAARHPGQTIALVAHGGVLDSLYRAATRVALDAPRTWQLGNASINRLLASGGEFTLVGWNDSGHLEGGRAGEQAQESR